MSVAIVLTTAASVPLQPAPISPDWILADEPEARCDIVSRSRDGASYTAIWECSVGRFNWHYAEDETVVLLSGEVFITDQNGVERRLGPGDTGFFPAGSSCTWRVTNPVRKIAILRKAMPKPFALAFRAWDKLVRMTGPRRASAI